MVNKIIINSLIIIIINYNIKEVIIILPLEMIIINFKKACDFILKGQTLIIHLNKTIKLGLSLLFDLNLIYLKFFIIRLKNKIIINFLFNFFIYLSIKKLF